ncbi:cytochrome c oxidase assembly protein [Microbacterium sp. Mu-80]|uniref:Cytochrome c oxidase assembly protein n=1 Tax=Microbacterium bandirmense TaxID=3122050 RepID=A0ABU8LF47_9MICO
MNDWIPDTPPTLEAFLTPILPPVPVLPVLGLLMAVLYLAGAIRLWRQGRRWSVARTVCFLLGCIVLVAVTGLAVEGYGYLLFSVFMFQQLTLMMAIPPLLVLGSPGTLLLRATPHRGLGRVILRLALAGLRSRIARWALSPWIAMPLFLMSFYGFYLGGLADPILQTPGGHPLLEIAFLAAGVLFTIPILSNDPLPVRMTYPGRAMDLFAEAALHAFFGVFLMMSPTLFVETFAGPTTALGIDPLDDQWLAGALAWSYGEGPTVVMLLYVMHRWFRDDTARAAKADKYADAHGDPELDAYNAYLDALRKKDT